MNNHTVGLRPSLPMIVAAVSVLAISFAFFATPALGDDSASSTPVVDQPQVIDQPQATTSADTASISDSSPALPPSTGGADISGVVSASSSPAEATSSLDASSTPQGGATAASSTDGTDGTATPPISSGGPIIPAMLSSSIPAPTGSLSISLVGSNPMVVAPDSVFVDPGATAVASDGSTVNMTSSTTPGGYVDTHIFDQLLYLAFDDGSGSTASDSSGSGNDGTLYGSPSWTSGRSGGALSFDGSLSQAVVTPSISLPSTFTISMWVNATSSGVNDMLGQGYDLVIGGYYGKAAFSMNNCLSCGVTSSANIDDGQWHMLTAVEDGATEYLYVDGAIVGSAPASYGGSSQAIDVGYSWSNGYYTGLMDDVRVFSHALSASQIQELYDGSPLTQEYTIAYDASSTTGLSASTDRTVIVTDSSLYSSVSPSTGGSGTSGTASISSSSTPPPTGGGATTGASSISSSSTPPPTGGAGTSGAVSLSSSSSYTPPPTGGSGTSGATSISSSSTPPATGGGGTSGATTTPASTSTPPINPNNNGGGGVSYSSSGSSIGGFSLPISTSSASTSPILSSCPLITVPILKLGLDNDPSQVSKLQAFLKDDEGLGVTVNGSYDQSTFDAVAAFQAKYLSDIMGPWGATKPSGIAYITTLKKVNEIACDEPFTLSPQDLAVIDAYKASLNAGGQNGTSTPIGPSLPNSTGTSTAPIIGQNNIGNQNVGAAAAAPGAASFLGNVWSSIKGFFSHIF